MRRYTLGLCTVLLALLLSIFWWGFRPYDERTQLVFNQNYGTITSGTKLGVRVGGTWEDADNAIRRQFRPDNVLWQSGVCMGDGSDGEFSRTPVLLGRATVSYRDRSWQNGVITLCLQDGVVSSVAWHYPGPFYIDL